MNTSGNTVLITGGATGIGFELARNLSELGNRVVVCGRRESKLSEAKQKLPGISVRRCDITKEAERVALAQWMAEDFQDVNVLVNNAGVQKLVDLKAGEAALASGDNEIETNFLAQVYLSALFVPILSKRKEAAIVNISSGLGFVPLARYPVYSATKAAMHSFSISLRYQLRDTPIRVFELIFPTVKDTELKAKQPARPGPAWGISPSEAVAEAMTALKNDSYEFAIGEEAKRLVKGSRDNPEGTFSSINH